MQRLPLRANWQDFYRALLHIDEMAKLSFSPPSSEASFMSFTQTPSSLQMFLHFSTLLAIVSTAHTDVLFMCIREISRLK